MKEQKPIQHHRQPIVEKQIGEFTVWIMKYDNWYQGWQSRKNVFSLIIWKKRIVTSQAFDSKKQALEKFNNVCAIIRASQKVKEITLPKPIEVLINADQLITKETLRNYLRQ